MGIKDRGIMKWQGFFMTEHVEVLKELDKERRKVPKPVIDESMFEEWEEKICCAMEHNLPVTCKVWKDGWISSVTGPVHHVNTIDKKFAVKSTEGFCYINFDSIIGVEIDESEPI